MIKKLLLLGLAFMFLGTLGAEIAHAQSSEDAAKKYGITFPIVELGNCTDITSCKTYCDDPLNIKSCVDYAKSKGFYREHEAKPSDSVIQKAKEVLGCDSIYSCKAFCEKEENFDKCHSFAQSSGLSGGYKEDPSKGSILTKAEEALGCDSYETCRTFCDNPVNHDRCAQFAKSAEVNGGYEYKGPGGCTSSETCRAFCSQPTNTDICRQFSQSSAAQSNYDPRIECKKHTGCTWSGTYCQCSQNDTNNLERQKNQCTSYPGCLWTGTTCQCSNTGTTERYTPYPYPTSNSGGTYDLATECAKHTGCSWTGSTCKCSSPPVQGIHTVVTWFQEVIYSIEQLLGK